MSDTEQNINADEIAQLFATSANFWQGQAMMMANQVRELRKILVEVTADRDRLKTATASASVATAAGSSRTSSKK